MLVIGRTRGFTLVELMIGVAIIALLMLLALPNYSQFMTNARVRSTADSLANGLRLAQVEAIRRNRDVEFEVNPATGWLIRDVEGALVIQREPFSDTAGGQVTIQPRPGGTTKLTFSSIGQYRAGNNPSDGSVAIQGILVNAGLMGTKKYRVVADPSLGIGMRVCDEAFNFPPEPDGCSALAMTI